MFESVSSLLRVDEDAVSYPWQSTPDFKSRCVHRLGDLCRKTVGLLRDGKFIVDRYSRFLVLLV